MVKILITIILPKAPLILRETNYFIWLVEWARCLTCWMNLYHTDKTALVTLALACRVVRGDRSLLRCVRPNINFNRSYFLYVDVVLQTINKAGRQKASSHQLGTSIPTFACNHLDFIFSCIYPLSISLSDKNEPRWLLHVFW